ncbi:MarR family transcriptional regulator [Prauserella marina]|uniref:DNA-binding transcriptional regulator, MarR family n=1 Tax=Prauserella marina TaxID=530584 RepID=A0A222W0X2_9PSEU|nr:MarR family transcriptional regulator [Prauserella marina]ASR39829.1 MarR family transcriptional regulator [Prauserella marina]PWV81993.1 MarR family transcriptional regulator [Prauserella marina]SDD16948.1 DNA-binding transcriptional regulator, MarR family [Prauserella marina]
MAPATGHAESTGHQPTAEELVVADELGKQMVRFMRAISRAKAQATKHGPDGIERAAYAILFTLVNDGPQRASKLADALHSDISTISRQSSSLVQHGLVERQSDPGDRRASLLAPTAEGIRVFEENRRLRGQWIATLLAEWPEADRDSLTALLARFNSELERFTPVSTDPPGDGNTEGDDA